MDKLRLDSVITEFALTVHTVYGLYLDGNAGFSHMGRLVGQSLVETLKKIAVENPQAATLQQVESLPFIYGTKRPTDPEREILHESTQGEFVARNRDGGRNSLLLGNLCLVMIYQYWEHYRAEIATVRSLQTREVTVPVFGDLRLLRNSIIHNRGIATAGVSRCEVMTWFKAGDLIEMDKDRVRSMIRSIGRALDELSPDGGEPFEMS